MVDIQTRFIGAIVTGIIIERFPIRVKIYCHIYSTIDIIED
jgi:hypothetical protein